MKPGFAFGDHITTGKIKRRRYDEEPPHFRMRSYLLPLILLITGMVLFWRLFELQIIHSSEYREEADSNRTRTQIVYAPRGIVFDRNGVPLILNVPGYRQIIKGKGNEFKTILLDKNQALDQLAKGANNIAVDSHRKYPYKDVTAHLLGYIGQISEDELKTFGNEYQANSWIGKSGIEQSYESALRGRDGKRLYEVDALGKVVRLLGQNDPIPGEDVTLTLDIKLQQAVYKAAKDIQKGAIIVSTPQGEILSMVSKPSYDPNLFTLDTTYNVSTESAYLSLHDILHDSNNHPLLNRAISGIYPPGSTFKLITSTAGLENHIIDEKYTVEDTGILKIGDFSYANWYYTSYGKKEPGKLDVRRALARSNDIFFYRLAEKIKIDALSNMAKKFGLGEKSGIDLNEEETGFVPTKEWKKEKIKEDWYLGDTFHLGIGQGFLLTTPLQVNNWTQVFANGGTLYTPQLFKEQQPKIKEQKMLSDKTVSLIRQGMIGSCSQGGVAFPLFNFRVKNTKFAIDGKNFKEVKIASGSAKKKFIEIPIACKTGTAEYGGKDTKPHAWITLFAPAYNPQVVVTVLVESGGEGSTVAAPIAKKVLEAYFSKN